MAIKNQDIQAVKDVMAKAPGMSYVDAARQVRGVQNPPAPIANAPIAGQAPAITPLPTETPLAPSVHDGGISPTEQQNRDIRAQNQAKVQAEIQTGTRPEVGTQGTPEQLPQIVQQAEAQKPAETITPVVPTPIAPTPTETKVETAPVVVQPTDKKGILTSLIQGQTVTPQNTPEYRKATATHTAFQKFNGMSEQQLLDNIKQGQITTEMGGLLAQNPAYQIARKKADDIASTNATNATIQNIKSGMTGKEITTPNYLQSISDELIKKFGLTDQSSQQVFVDIVTNDPEIVNYTKQLHDINRQVADTTNMLNKGYQELKSAYGDLTQSQMMNYMASNFKEANDLLGTLNNTRTYLEADLKNATDMAVAEYGAKQADIAQINQMKNQVFGQAVQSQFALAQKLQEQGIADELAVQALNDPAKAIPALIEQYTKLGVPMQRSTQAIIAEAQNYMAQGGTLADYLTNLQKTIQSKPEYQRIQEMQQGQMTDREKYANQLAMGELDYGRELAKIKMQYDMSNEKGLTDFRRDLIAKGVPQQEVDAIVRNETGNWGGAKGASLLYADDGTFIPSTLKETTNPYGGIECAEYLSRMTGSKVGNTWEEKVKLNNEPTGGVGSIAIWKPSDSGDFAKYGHAGIIVGEQGDNYLIKSANYNGDGRISTDIVPKTEIQGYRSTALGGKETSEPLTDKQFTQSNQIITSFKSDPQVKAFEEAYSQGMSLIASLNDKTGPGDVAAIFQFMKTLDPASVVRESEFEVAAKSAGVTEYIGNTWDRITQGKKLTDTQAEAFGKLSKQFILDKAKLYDTKYSDGIRRLEKQGIDTSVFPDSTAEQMRQSLGGGKENDIITVVNNLVPDRYKGYFQ